MTLRRPPAGSTPAPPRPARWALIGLLLIWGAVGCYLAANGHTWLDEATYLVKSLAYITGQTTPYSDADATWYMPLFFYELGAWQWLTGLVGLDGLTTARMFSVLLAGAQGLLLFAIVRRVTGQDWAGLSTAALLLLTPASAFYFATAVPAAATALLHLCLVWLLITLRDRPVAYTAVALGLLSALLYFHRPNMLPAIAMAGGLLVILTPGDRLKAGGLFLIAGAGTTAAILALFPAKLTQYALNVPVLRDVLAYADLFPDRLSAIDATTRGNYLPALSPDAFVLGDFLDAFALPYAGTLAVLLLGVVAATLRWQRTLSPLLLATAGAFLLLAGIHYAGSVHYCRTCILPYTPYFASLAALAFGLTMAMLVRRPAAIAALTTAVLIGNFAASHLAGRPGYHGFPLAMTSDAPPDRVLLPELTGWMQQTLPAGARVLILTENPLAPLAAARAGLSFPPQSLNLRYSQRHVTGAPLTAETEQLLVAENYWTDAILTRWITDDYDWLILDPPPRWGGQNAATAVSTLFSPVDRITIRNQTLAAYSRNP